MTLDPQAPPPGRCVASTSGMVRRFMAAVPGRGFAPTVIYEAIRPKRDGYGSRKGTFAHEITESAWRSWAKGGTVLPEDWTPEQGTATTAIATAELERLRARVTELEGVLTTAADTLDVAARWLAHYGGTESTKLAANAADCARAALEPQ